MTIYNEHSHEHENVYSEHDIICMLELLLHNIRIDNVSEFEKELLNNLYNILCNNNYDNLLYYMSIGYTICNVMNA